MGLSSWVGGYTRDHGFLKLGGRIYERTWVSQARWGDIQETMGLLSWVGEYMREHGSPKLGGRIYERT